MPVQRYVEKAIKQFIHEEYPIKSLNLHGLLLEISTARSRRDKPKGKKLIWYFTFYEYLFMSI